MSSIPDSQAWRDLDSLRDAMDGRHLRRLFETDPTRGTRLGIALDDLYFDFSRQLVDADVEAALARFADEVGVPVFLDRMAAGEVVNGTENRPALHTALRGTATADPAITEEIAAVDTRLKSFVEDVHAGGRFTAVVAVGIGGSELGPALSLDALADGYAAKLDVRICGNIDGIAFERAIAGLDPATTLLVVISKSFATMETAENARRAGDWLRDSLGDAWVNNVCAVSANTDATGALGIDPERVFPMWDWVGGRFSLMSAVGLPVALAYGWDTFLEMRSGARVMDAHALSAPVLENAPVMMALMTLWNASVLGLGAEGVVPYDTRLQLLVPYLQQLQMESNGKSVTTAGEPVAVATQPVVFGGVGTNVQHAFFQQLHQGPDPVPVDILIPATPPAGDAALHDHLVSNALAQADALAFGRDNMAEPHRHYPGNRPTTVILYRDLSAAMLGQLIALYEHKTAAAGALWGINSFDQWGVELGKSVSKDVLKALNGEAPSAPSLVPALKARQHLQDESTGR